MMSTRVLKVKGSHAKDANLEKANRPCGARIGPLTNLVNSFTALPVEKRPKILRAGTHAASIIAIQLDA